MPRHRATPWRRYLLTALGAVTVVCTLLASLALGVLMATGRFDVLVLAPFLLALIVAVLATAVLLRRMLDVRARSGRHLLSQETP